MSLQTTYRALLAGGAIHEFPSPEHAAAWLAANPQTEPVWVMRRTVVEAVHAVYGTPQSPPLPPVPPGLPALAVVQQTVARHGLAPDGQVVVG